MEGKEEEEAVKLMKEWNLNILGVCKTSCKGQGIRTPFDDYEILENIWREDIEWLSY